MTRRKCPFKIKKIPLSHKAGKIIPHPHHPEKKDEIICAEILRRFGNNIIFLPESSYLAGPDCIWRNLKWKIKTLYGNSLDNTMHAVKAANEQSHNIIINGTKTKRSIEQIAFDAINAYEQIKSQKPQNILILKHDEYCLLNRPMLKC